MFEKKEKIKITETDAYNVLKEWSEHLEVRLNDEDFEEVQKELFRSVQNERLSFDKTTDEFTYKLKKPILTDAGDVAHSIIKISDCEMKDKRDMHRSKNPTDQGIEMFKVYISQTDGEDIAHGHIGRIKSSDEIIITAVILGFFVQAVPGN